MWMKSTQMYSRQQVFHIGSRWMMRFFFSSYVFHGLLRCLNVPKNGVDAAHMGAVGSGNEIDDLINVKPAKVALLSRLLSTFLWRRQKKWHHQNAIFFVTSHLVYYLVSCCWCWWWWQEMRYEWWRTFFFLTVVGRVIRHVAHGLHTLKLSLFFSICFGVLRRYNLGIAASFEEKTAVNNISDSSSSSIN